METITDVGLVCRFTSGTHVVFVSERLPVQPKGVHGQSHSGANGAVSGSVGYESAVFQAYSEAETEAKTFKWAGDEWQNGGRRILDQRDIADDQVIFHLEARRPEETMEADINMRKSGAERKFDGIQHRKILAAREPR